MRPVISKDHNRELEEAVPKKPRHSRRAAKLISSLLIAFLSVLIISFRESSSRAADQENELKNPLAGDAKAIKEGHSIFRADCAYCHGFDARGGTKGPNLTSGRWIHGDNDSQIFHTITKGVPGTEMPALDFTDEETWAVIAYLRSTGERSGAPAGNPEVGKQMFFGKGICASCHMVNGKGGRLGPDLSRIGAVRSTRYLIDSIRFPSKDLAETVTDPNHGLRVVYDTVTVVTKEGRRITGVAKNEDTFSLQLMDDSGQLDCFLKRDLKDLTHIRKSLMPAYDESVLSEKELQDLIAYLAGLRGR
jgi:cytochrome c oxidase cbb3-type subunit 3